MIIQVIADNHGHVRPLKQAIPLNKNSDFMIHAGDIVCEKNRTGRETSGASVDIVRASELEVLAGNHEYQLRASAPELLTKEQLLYISTLPESYSTDGLLFTHEPPGKNKAMFYSTAFTGVPWQFHHTKRLFPSARINFIGHYHYMFIIERGKRLQLTEFDKPYDLSKGEYIVNVGALEDNMTPPWGRGLPSSYLTFDTVTNMLTFKSL